MIAKIIVAVGVTAAAVGFGFLGISTSTYETHETARTAAIALMAGGGIAAVVGLFWYRAAESQRP